MSWTGWQKGTKIFPNSQVNINIADAWVHYLVAPPDEPNPDKNHIHVKISTDLRSEKGYIVCAVKVDGIHAINRRKLIEDINRETGLNLFS